MKKITLLTLVFFVFSFTHAQYLNEGFETAVPPTGWLDEVGSTNGANTDIWEQTTTQANSGTYSAYFNDGGAGDRWLISPVMDLSGGTTPQLTYYDHVNFVSFADTHDVLYSTDYSGSGDPEVATWTLINGVIGTEDTWVENGPYALPLNATVYIAFHYIGDNAADWYIDDVLVQEPPSCLPPTDVTDNGGATATTLGLLWTLEPNASDYEAEIGLPGFTPGNGEAIASGPTGNTNGVAFTGLTPETTYDMYVRSNCGGDGYSIWVGPITDTTLATCIDPSSLALDSVTFTDAVVSWVNDASTTAVEFEFGLDGFTPGTATSVAAGGGPAVAGADSAGAGDVLMSGTAYDFYVRSDCGGGDLSNWAGPLSFTTPTPPPANDDFANAAPVACDGNYTGSTENATLDEDDAPDSSSPNVDLDAPNVWYSYTGSGTPEDITLNLCPSGYDSSVLVYTGTSGNLTLVAANDDGGEANCGAGSGSRSFLTFQSDGTTTYYITIEGWNVGNTGAYDMTVTCVAQAPAPPNDLCANAEMLTLTVPTSGTTVGATGELGDDNPTCESGFATIVDVWYSVEITGGTSDLNINTTITGTSDQANVAVYSDCTLATQLGCSDANGGENLTVPGLAAGTYIIRVWGDGVAARTEGTFDIVADATLSTESFDNEAAFTYYPNPVKNTLTLNAQNNIENVTMFNMLGQEVLRATPNTINSDVDMSGLANGAYFVKVTIAGTTQTIRVIKQ